jgi:hypothetical protein
MGGGGKTPIDALARASGLSPPHGGIDWSLGTRGQSPWRSPSRIAAAIRTKTAPLHGAKPPDALRAGQVGQRASGHERGERACGLVQEHRALRSMATGHAGQSASSRNSRSASNAPDRHPDGPGLQARSAPADRAGCPIGQPIHDVRHMSDVRTENRHRQNFPQGFTFCSCKVEC